MKLVSNVVRSYGKLRWQFGQPLITRSFSANWGSGNTSSGRQSDNTFESADDFEKRIFSNVSGSNEETNSFFRNLDKIERTRGKGAGSFSSGSSGQNNHQLLDGLEDTFSTLSDGMDGKLKKAATYFAFGDEIIGNEEYKFRPDVTFPSGREVPGLTYTTEDLDLTKPGIQKEINRRPEFETTTKEVLEKADFRNVRFLANFITAAGIMKKRKMTGISAKAQRKVAREIKTARAFGLMPFTTMGQKPFRFGQSMKETYDDFNYGPPTRGRWGMPLQPEAESLDVDSLIGSNLDEALEMPDPQR